jgi:HEAT repeat protein
LSATLVAKDPDMQKFMVALRAAGKAAAPPLLEMIRTGDSTARLHAAEIAGRLGPATVEALCQELEGDAPVLARVASARALGLQGKSDRARQALLVAAARPDFRVAGAALAALGRFGGEEAQTRLVQVLQGGGGSFLRRQAARGIGLLGKVELVPILIAYLEEMIQEKDDLGRDGAKQALRQLTGQHFGPRPKRWRRWWADRKR